MNRQVDLQQLAVQREDPARPAPGRRRHLVTRYVIPLVLLAGFLAVVVWAGRDTYLPRQPVTVIPVIATRAEVREAGTPLFNAAGWVEPRPTPVRVPALASGVIERLLVVEDQAVEAGEPVAYLIEEDAALALQAAEATARLRNAELGQAGAELERARTELNYPVHLEAALAEADVALAQVETALAAAPFELRRAEARQRLAGIDLESKVNAATSIARVRLEEARSEADTATALVEDLRQKLASLGKEKTALSRRTDALRKQLELTAREKEAVATAEARVDAAAARLREAEAAVSIARLRLDRMTVRAPVAGRVLQLLAGPGSHLSTGDGGMTSPDRGVVATMYRPDSLQVRVDVRFDDLPQVAPGQPVRIQNPALPGPLAGEVLFLSSLVDIQKNILEVKVGIDSPPALLKPEMLVDVTFLAPDRDREEGSREQLRVFVPSQLVESGDGGAFVWVADAGAGRARRQPVRVGRASGGLTEVTDGLSVASRLIVGGRDGLRDGSRIAVTGEDGSLGVGWTAEAGGR